MRRARGTDTKHYFENDENKEGKVYIKTDDGMEWVVPRVNIWQIYKLCNDDIGHFGMEKAIAKIKDNY